MYGNAREMLGWQSNSSIIHTVHARTLYHYVFLCAYVRECVRVALCQLYARIVRSVAALSLSLTRAHMHTHTHSQHIGGGGDDDDDDRANTQTPLARVEKLARIARGICVQTQT